jgi:alkaline phosphatase
MLLICVPVALLSAQDGASRAVSTASPRNIILFIGDGMGPAQIDATSLFATGERDALLFHDFPAQALVATSNARSRVTDSAASATAMATGVKVANGALSVLRPGSRRELPTIFELAADAGLAVGFVTTTSVTHATVAAFAAHEPRRHWYRRIARDYLEQTRPNVIFGGAAKGVSAAAFREAGYTVATDRQGLASFAGLQLTSAADAGRYAVLLGNGHLPYLADGRPGEMPGLPELTAAAIELLSHDPDGFVLVVEAGRIDHAGHANDIERLIPELLELEQTVGMVLEMPEVVRSSLIVVTADHETGGLAVVENRGAGVVPEVTWSTVGHTGVDVPLFATGPGAEALATIRDNTEIFQRMREALGL